MKKTISLAFVFVFIVSLFFVKDAAAIPLPPPPPPPPTPVDTSIAPGSWSTGTEFDVDLVKYPVPYDWMQLLTKGVTITEAGTICHKFRGGQFEWIGDIRQLVDGKWVKIPTTQGWLNGEEAPYMVCGTAPSAGTYALFGYFTGSAETRKTCNYDTSLWSGDEYEGHLEINFPYDFPIGLLVTYQILDSSPNLDADTTGSSYTYDDFFTYVTFYDSYFSVDGDWWADVLVTVDGCSVVVAAGSGPDGPPPLE
jgi:hypothetical protein